ncbi:MAG: hypothetical protein ACK56F_02775, partial [bacterium]
RLHGDHGDDVAHADARQRAVVRERGVHVELPQPREVDGARREGVGEGLRRGDLAVRVPRV